MASIATTQPRRPLRLLGIRLPSPRDVLPGVLLCVVVTGAAYAAQRLEADLFGKAWLEALVLAILIGTVVRTAWTPGAMWQKGIDYSARFLLEVAVVLLGASISTETLVATGPRLLLGIVLVVALAIAISFTIGRLLGLPHRMALLVACGNSICGNSAIAAVAPVIGADSEDVAASIAFTAVLGVIVVLLLPVLGLWLGLAGHAYGAFAGLTVYAVPQVLAAAAPMGALALQSGTLVKLVRVLMLGPVCMVLAFVAPFLPHTRAPEGEAVAGGEERRSGLPPLSRLMPWFIIGFLAMMALRSFGLIPQPLLTPLATVSTALTVLSMAALGLGVDVRTVARAGVKVTAAVTLSLVALGGLSVAVLHLTGVA
ncbi:MAG: putative sulfate exporter family transporter [Sphingomonadales bacterium]|nr:putative sulfate exporter family transporter [Sphingomonadales bacterium]MDE2569419.1 putative sulfate exporter family transporter [Sphingomonadales bacterium]